MVSTQQPSTKHDILQYLLRQNQATAQELAEQLQVTPQAIRRHLKDLETEGLLVHEAVQVGMGRPQHLYQLSQEGRSRFPDSYSEFAVSLLDTLAETVGREQVSTILRKQWERKAAEYRDNLGTGPLQERIANLVQLRRAEGFMAEWHPLDSVDSEADSTANAPQENSNSNHNHRKASTDRFIVTEYHCAISHIAQSYPTVCGHELELFTEALPDCTVERTHWIVNGEHRCGYLIQAKNHG